MSVTGFLQVTTHICDLLIQCPFLEFKTGKVPILLATDVAARGLGRVFGEAYTELFGVCFEDGKKRNFWR
jgi:hypothetical protein